MSDSLVMCDGLAASMTFGNRVLVCAKRPTPPTSQVENVDHLMKFKMKMPIARDSVCDSVIEV